MSEQQHRTGGGRHIGPDTKLTIASALSVAAVVIVATWRMSATVATLDGTLRSLSRSQWTIIDQERFANRLERHNPPLKVPDTMDIIRSRPSGEQEESGIMGWPKSGNMMLWDGPTWEAGDSRPPTGMTLEAAPGPVDR